MPKTLKKAFLAIYLAGLHLVAIYFIGGIVVTKVVDAPEFGSETVSDPTEKTDVPAPLPVPSQLYYPPTPDPVTQPQSTIGVSGLIIPVQGIRPEQLTDSFVDARSGGRIHDAIDIAAPAGTPVIAAADGEIVKFFDSVPGGITIYQLSSDRKFIYYYAHLQRRADGISVGDKITQGRIIGYVGDTGNAGAGNYHLHFSIASVTDPKRYWEGSYVNPYPLLRNR